MSVAGPVASVASSLIGVKRPLRSDPAKILSDLPSNRGNDVQPDGAVSAPPLMSGNRQNRGTNVTVPYARVCPFYPDQPRIGRVSAGDVLFIDREFLGKLDKLPSAGVGTRDQCVGLDAVNRRLHGSTHPDGWVEGLNCFRIKKNQDVDALFVQDRNDKTVLMTELERYKLDGVVLSNDERDTYSAASSQQNVVFNVAVQGRALVNNGYAAYDTFQTNKSTEGYQVTARPERNLEGSVEAYPRGSVENALRNSMNGVIHSTKRQSGQVGYPRSASDVIFTGFYARYPLQMFDRHPLVGDTLYVGLRVYMFGDNKVGNTADRIKIRKLNSDGIYQDGETTPDKGAFCFCQYITFTGRQAHLCAQKQKIEEQIVYNEVQAADAPKRVFVTGVAYQAALRKANDAATNASTKRTVANAAAAAIILAEQAVAAAQILAATARAAADDASEAYYNDATQPKMAIAQQAEADAQAEEVKLATAQQYLITESLPKSEADAAEGARLAAAVRLVQAENKRDQAVAFQASLTTDMSALKTKSSQKDDELTKSNRYNKFDSYEFDCIRQKDFNALAGVWTVGRIMDTRATRLPGYDIGPEDTATGLTVDVSIAWYPWLKVSGSMVGPTDAVEGTKMTSEAYKTTRLAYRAGGRGNVDLWIKFYKNYKSSMGNTIHAKLGAGAGRSLSLAGFRTEYNFLTRPPSSAAQAFVAAHPSYNPLEGLVLDSDTFSSTEPTSLLLGSAEAPVEALVEAPVEAPVVTDASVAPITAAAEAAAPLAAAPVAAAPVVTDASVAPITAAAEAAAPLAAAPVAAAPVAAAPVAAAPTVTTNPTGAGILQTRPDSAATAVDAPQLSAAQERTRRHQKGKTSTDVNPPTSARSLMQEQTRPSISSKAPVGAAAAARPVAAKTRTESTVDSVFNTLFGASTSTAAASSERPTSPALSSGSDGPTSAQAPKATRRSRAPQ